MERMDRIAHGPVSTVQITRDLERVLACCSGQQDLAPAHKEGISRAQALVECLALGWQQLADKDWSSHAGQYTTLPKSLPAYALAGISMLLHTVATLQFAQRIPLPAGFTCG